MRIQPEFAVASPEVASPCSEEDEAVVGLQASLRSSDSLKGILECAKGRCRKRDIDGRCMHDIERICGRYEQHQKDVRDHCLDYFNAAPSQRLAPCLRERTNELVLRGRELYGELRSVLLSTY